MEIQDITKRGWLGEQTIWSIVLLVNRDENVKARLHVHQDLIPFVKSTEW